MSKNRKTTLFRKMMRAHLLVLAAAVLILGAAFVFFTSHYLGAAAQEEMERAARLAQNVTGRNLEGAALTSRLLAQNYEIRSGLKTCDPAMINNQIQKELRTIQADFVSVAGADGVVFCRTSRRNPPPDVREVTASEPLFLSRVFQSVTFSGAPQAGIEPIYPNSIGIVSIAPTRGERGEILGFVRIGFYLDERFINLVRGLTQAELAIEYRDSIITATVPLPDGGEPPSAESLRKKYIIHRAPIRSGSRTVAHLLALYPKSKIAGVQKQGITAIAAIAIIALAVSVLASARISRRIVVPLNELISGTNRIRAGDLTHRLPRESHDEIGDLASAFNSMTDSLQQRDAEIRTNQEQLIESGKLAAVGELAAGVAHEVGNPLAAIFGYVQLLRNAAPDKKDHYLDEISKEVGFIDLTIRELLEFSRPSRIETEAFSLDEAVDEALRMLGFHKMMKYVDVIRERALEPPVISGSKKELVQAVLNIALNAAQAMHGHGKLTITTETGEDSAAVRIHDTGPGIHQADLKHIFEPFYTTKRSGTGLGLSITYRIIQRHNGSIQVVSSPEAGTTFAVLMPRRKEDEKTDEAPPEQNPTGDSA